jgi:hypothetical protein
VQLSRGDDDEKMGSIDFRRRTGVLGFRLQQRLRHGDQRWRMILTDGKPAVDDDTGLISYEDQQGNKMQINRDDVSQIIKR